MFNVFVVMFIIAVQSLFMWVSFKLTKMTPLEFWKHPHMWMIAAFSAIGMYTTMGNILTYFFLPTA